MPFLYIAGAKYVSFGNQTLNPEAFVPSLTKSIAISHFFVWENVCCRDTSCYMGCLTRVLAVGLWLSLLEFSTCGDVNLVGRKPVGVTGVPPWVIPNEIDHQNSQKWPKMTSIRRKS